MTVLGHLRRRPVVFGFVLLAALVAMLVSESSYHRSTAALENLGRRAQARLALQSLQLALLNAESGQRGYLITERRDYLGRFDTAFVTAAQSLHSLRSFYLAEPERLHAVDKLNTLVDSKLQELRTIIDLHDAGKTESWRTVMLTDIGKEQMDAIQSISSELVAEQSTSIDAGRQLLYRTLVVDRIGVALVTLLSLLALLMYLRRTSLYEERQAEQQRRLQMERDRLEGQVSERTALLTELATHLQTAREDERSRLARELHDELGALLTAAKLDVARLKSRIPDMTVEASNRIAHLNETLNSGIALKRRIIEDLRPSSLGNLGLVAALDIQAREFSERSGLKVKTSFETARLTPSVELTIYRLVQEALANIAKYASASQVEIALYPEEGDIVVSVKDDGKGFDTSLARPETHGLLGMRYRVEAARGKMMLESQIGAGTTVSAILPLLDD